MGETAAVFGSAARAFALQVRRIAASDWSSPALGDWDLRALVGHTSRSLTTVSTYLRAPCDHEDITSPAAYYTYIRGDALGIDPADIVERGRQAGRDLGADPVATVDGLVEAALADVAGAADPVITVIGGLGIRLSNYLPTRIFELAVHGLDIARATGVDAALPDDVLEAATVLAARIAVTMGDGGTVLTALTGRSELPPSYSVV